MLLITLAGVLYFYYQRFTHLPLWYISGEKPPNEENTVYYNRDDLKQLFSNRQDQNDKPLQKKDSIYSTLTLNAKEAHYWIMEPMIRTLQSDSLTCVIRASYLKIEEKRVEIGAILHLASLLKNYRETKINKLFSSFPFIETEEVSVSLSGKPVVEKGCLTFDSAATIRIGKTVWTLTELAHFLGESPERIRKKLIVKPMNQSYDSVHINHQHQIELYSK